VIRAFLRSSAPRLLLVLLAGLMFYLMEPGFHLHEAAPGGLDMDLGPVGISATLANLSGLSMLILLAGFIAVDRRRGYYRLILSHPVSPLRYYGTRWMLALALSMGAAAAFLVVGQTAAWGEYRGGASGLFLALLSAVAYGGLIAFLSAALPRGDAWVGVLLFLFTYLWLKELSLGAEPFFPAVRSAISLLLPPQTALQDVYDDLLRGTIAWDAAAFSAGYGAFWLGMAGLLVRLREWP
jgi:hypothetical protein